MERFTMESYLEAFACFPIVVLHNQCSLSAETRIIRKTIARYAILSSVLAWRSISLRVLTRTFGAVGIRKKRTLSLIKTRRRMSTEVLDLNVAVNSHVPSFDANNSDNLPDSNVTLYAEIQIEAYLQNPSLSCRNSTELLILQLNALLISHGYQR
ncbi:hypothetical protein NECAME_17827 [Necator americanus]|uniref:Bestrophin homolog n=1 Tax=Necator americanus TaxID=51031 RepID=W2TKQ7_NECAM|nr:hypothetical protein NECAME_17827 [Necator americanus]ETN81741.1 hypothetical protein NECAME_17827 [Necator americanus]